MKKLASILFLTCISFASMAHEYFFSFAEMEYNDITRKFEITISLTTHDLEKIYEKKGGETIDLAKYEINSSTTRLITEYFSNHFQLKTENQVCVLRLLGFESSLNGVTNFYFESEPIDITPTLEIKNDILMDEYLQQQNKITLYYQTKSYTTDFLSNERKTTLLLN